MKSQNTKIIEEKLEDSSQNVEIIENQDICVGIEDDKI